MELIDHLSHVLGAFAWLLDNNLVPELLDLVDEGLYVVFMDKDVVWRDTDLPRVRNLAHADLGRGEVNISTLINDCWAFTAKFEQAWCQILRCCLRDDSADLSRACEADFVNRQVVDSDGNIRTSLESDIAIRVQILVNELFHDSTRGW